MLKAFEQAWGEAALAPPSSRTVDAVCGHSDKRKFNHALREWRRSDGVITGVAEHLREAIVRNVFWIFLRSRKALSI